MRADPERGRVTPPNVDVRIEGSRVHALATLAPARCVVTVIAAIEATIAGGNRPMDELSSALERVLLAAHCVLLTDSVASHRWLSEEFRKSFELRAEKARRVDVRLTDDGGILVVSKGGRGRKLCRHGSYWAIAGSEAPADEPEWRPTRVASILAGL